MPAYTLPGTEVGPRRARVLGACAVLITVLGVVAWRAAPETKSANDIHVTLVTTTVGEGVGSGTDVRLDGMRVGSVAEVASAGPGRQHIDLTLQRSQLFGLTDALSVDYAPGNLFGISALQLHSGSGGDVLTDGTTVDLTGPRADRVRDATLAALLGSTGTLTDDVLTPKLAELLRTASHDISAFTPLLRAVGTTARSFAETQLMPPSLLFDRFGSVLAGLPPMLAGALRIVYSAYTNQYFQTPEHIAKYSEMFDKIQYELLPTVTRTATTGNQYFGGFIPIATAILDQLSGSIGDPAASAPRLRELLERLGVAFHDTPDGPVLDAGVEVGTGGR
ncbi:hypothetical protein ACFYTQ_23415 [Nocardia sp. NPDC004068]|uniref:hypothetical protein n=1 Tax=Nocardia sp. NPDC004068 TaxID=3364303 RepID=UPI003682D068